MKPHNGSLTNRHTRSHRVHTLPNTGTTPSREAIAERAYALWMAAGCIQGQDVEFWLEAERQLRDGCACALTAEIELLPT